MDKAAVLKSVAARVAADVRLEIPLQRAMDAVYPELLTLRNGGVKWMTIADALATAGVVGRAGKLIAETYVRDLFSRSASKVRQAEYRALLAGRPVATLPALRGGQRVAPSDTSAQSSTRTETRGVSKAAPPGPPGNLPGGVDAIDRAFAEKAKPRRMLGQESEVSAVEKLTGRKRADD